MASNMTMEILTGLLAFITAIYAWLTYRISKANEAVVAAMTLQREAAIRPYVTISTLTVPKDVRIYLRIENTGKAAAERLRLSLDKAFHPWGRPDEDLQRYPAFSQEIDSLTPGMRLVFTLATGPVLFGEKADAAITPLTFTIRARYQWGKQLIDETTLIDLRPYLRSDLEGDPIVDQLKGIREELKKRS